MRRRQPDNRIHPENLGMMFLNGKRFVINLRPGVPFNACIEEFQDSLRCWASHHWLDNRAAGVIEGYAALSEGGSFTWNDDVKRGPMACTKGGHKLYKVIFP